MMLVPGDDIQHHLVGADVQNQGALVLRGRCGVLRGEREAEQRGKNAHKETTLDVLAVHAHNSIAE